MVYNVPTASTLCYVCLHVCFLHVVASVWRFIHAPLSGQSMLIVSATISQDTMVIIACFPLPLILHCQPTLPLASIASVHLLFPCQSLLALISIFLNSSVYCCSPCLLFNYNAMFFSCYVTSTAFTPCTILGYAWLAAIHFSCI